MIFFRSIVKDNNTVLFEAVENELSCGECTLDLSGKNAVIESITFDKDKLFIAEGLLKAAYNYAATKNFYMGVCKCENIKALLLRLRFEKTENGYISDIPSILMGSCCKK